MTATTNTEAMARTHPRRGAVCFLALIVMWSLSAGAPVRAQKISNPDLYLKSLGAAAEAIGHYGLVEDQEVLERVNRIGYRLARVSGYDKYPFTFAVVDMPVPNAFALPAGQIFVTRGMLDLDLDDDMLANLLGHEITHVTQEHFLHMRKRATLLTVLSQIATLGAAAIAANSNDTYQGPGGYLYRDTTAASILQATHATGAVITELLLRSYSRENEDESDEEGQRLAALAGFDPDGARRLMQRMSVMIPQSKTFGYWRTHPFFDERVLAAEARQTGLRQQEATPDQEIEELRQATQATLLEFLRGRRVPEPSTKTIKQAALIAWPQGESAEELRLEKLHRARDEESERLAQSRDYGRILRLYKSEMESVRALTPKSPFLQRLTDEMGAMKSTLEDLYPQATAVLDGDVYEMPFLEAFASNYPESPRSDGVALELGIAYSRLGRETDAVKQLLAVWESPASGELATRAQRGLKNLAPLLDRLGALEVLSIQERDFELAELATRRLDDLASKYEDIANGADYLRQFPAGRYVPTVTHRLHTLADTLYREMILYQELGDAAKAIERANSILENAPLSPAAERLGRQLQS